MDTQNTPSISERLWRWTANLGCFLFGGWLGGVFGGLINNLFSPTGRDWSAGWVVIVCGLVAVAGGIQLIRLRHRFIGFAVSGFGIGSAALASFAILLLKTLPSC